ncbi:HK97 gp10 family phage protein [Sphingomonas soli]|uniref:HK97 gp10 family phage protein n=1 Tax=Sphingomonas soli TaxID=266127 RepID=UPI000A673D25|nr:HK97 gp10 family phage protein [Sphingomonas soli]
MPLRGHKAHIARLKKLSGAGPTRFVGAALFEGGERIQTTAQILITTGAVSGKGHVASLPGEAPNNDMGDLANGIETVQKAPLLVEVSSNSDHAMIEFDWGNTAARPHIRPARDAERPGIVKLVERAMNQAVRQSRSKG